MFDDLQNQSDQKNKPPLEPPAPTAPKENISQRIKGLVEQGSKQGKRKTIYSAIGIAVILLFAGGTIAAGYYFWPDITAGFNELIGKSELTDDMGINNNLENEAAGNQDDYYQELIKGCEKFKGSVMTTDYDCCIQTVEIMRKNNYKLEPQNGCPEGSQVNSLWCMGAYAWCEPIYKEANENVAASSTEEDMNLDSDDDGLTDAEEAQYGTDANNPDSDGDGYLDGDEVKNGYNPMGEGKLDESINQNETSDWKTYRNEEYGFEFSYWKDFEIAYENTNLFVFDDRLKEKNPECAGNPECVSRELTIRVIKDKTLADYRDKYSELDNSVLIKIFKTGFVDNHKAKWGYEPAMIDNIFVAIEAPSGGIIEISFSGPGVYSYIEEDFNQNFKQTISTFKFIEKDEIK